jgi:protein arginine kinase activator
MSKLYGENIKGVQETPTTLCCGACGITLEEVRMGAQLGCPLCYEIFSDEIIHELVLLEKVSPKVAVPRKAGPLHCGRIPGQPQEIDPSLKILELQQVLNETLKREDYEQAARLRDQIRAIEETQRKGRRRYGKG